MIVGSLVKDPKPENKKRKVHHVKTLEVYFKQNLMGEKPVTIRFNDRDYQPGDILIKDEITNEGNYTGRNSTHEIINVIDFPEGLKEGYVVLPLKYISSQVKNYIDVEVSDV